MSIKNKILNFNKIISKNKIFQSKFFIAFLFFTLGVISVIYFQKIKKNYELSIIKKHFYQHQYLNEDFYNFFLSDQIDHDLKKMHEEIKKSLEHDDDFYHHFKESFNKNFHEFNQNSSQNNSELKIRQDDKNIYYELNFSGYNKDEITVEIKDNILNFKAQKNLDQESLKNSKTASNQIKNQDQNIQKSFSSFNYSFLIEDNVDLSKPYKINRLEQKIIVEFSKKEK